MTASNISKVFTLISEEIQTSPVVSHVITGVLLIVFEKMLEVEFVCPCSGKIINCLFVLCYFAGPAFAVLLLVCCAPNYKNIPICSHTLVPSITWWLILLLDGRYFACALTHWSGNYEVTDGGGLMRWCKSVNNSSENLSCTHRMYTISQALGIILTMIWVPTCYHILLKLEKKPSDPAQQSHKPKKQDETEVNLSLVGAGPSSQTTSQGESDKDKKTKKCCCW